MGQAEPWGWWYYAEAYAKAAQTVLKGPRLRFDAPALHLLEHALELSLKAYLLAAGYDVREVERIGHSLPKLLTKARACGLDKHYMCFKGRPPINPTHHCRRYNICLIEDFRTKQQCKQKTSNTKSSYKISPPYRTLNNIVCMFSTLGNNGQLLRYLQTGFQWRIENDIIVKSINRLIEAIQPHCFRNFPKAVINNTP